MVELILSRVVSYMHELIVRFFQRKTTTAEEQALVEWRAASPENEQEFQEIEHVWRMTADLAPDSEAPPPTADEIVRRARELPPREPNEKLRRALPARHRIERDANGDYRLFLLDDEEDERRRKESGGA
jgi:ferric-dicitrate binding protein FerR (iron transport regulator)